MPAREQGGRKLSDEEPGKAPRLNSAVRRTKMEVEDAKMSGNFSSEIQYILTPAWKSRRKSVETDASKMTHFASHSLMNHAFFG